jgi:hypothetical protein
MDQQITRAASPTPITFDISQLNGKLGARPSAPPAPPAPALGPLQLIENKIGQNPVLRQREEPTDNWDDDFEEGISFTKIQALDKTTVDEDKTETEDLSRTIRPTRSPGANPKSLVKPPPVEMGPIVEDYSDLADEEEEIYLQEKVADFKVSS